MAALLSRFFGAGDVPAFDLEGYVRAQSGIVIIENDRGGLPLLVCPDS